MSSGTCCSDICPCFFPLLPSHSFERCLCRFCSLSETCYSDLCSSSFSLFPCLFFLWRDPDVEFPLCLPICLQRCLSLCRFSTLCLPVCLQRPVAQVSALFPSLSLSIDPYVGSLLTVSPSVFRNVFLISILCRISTLSSCLSLETCYSGLCFSSFSVFSSLSRDPYAGSPLSVSPSVFRYVFLISIPV